MERTAHRSKMAAQTPRCQYGEKDQGKATVQVKSVGGC